MFKVVRVLLLGGMVGKLLGVLRELIFAWLFGTGAVASAFRLAQSAFLIPLHGFVSESINGAFTPKYSAQRETEPHRAAAHRAFCRSRSLGSRTGPRVRC